VLVPLFRNAPLSASSSGEARTTTSSTFTSSHSLLEVDSLLAILMALFSTGRTNGWKVEKSRIKKQTLKRSWETSRWRLEARDDFLQQDLF
jgi:hypothetical protein